MTEADRPIGVFDSGVGGLTVAKAICDALPNEDIIYLGDTARLPYGTKSAETVQRYAINTTSFLLQQDIKALVIACNTASAVALDYLSEHSPVPVIGVIEPGAQAAAAATHTQHIGVIGTVRTVSSQAYQKAINAVMPNAHIYARPCPLFVPLAEENFVDHPATNLIARTYLDPFAEFGIDTLLLGCTHYPVLAPVIRSVLADSIRIVDSAGTTATALQRLLTERDLRKHGSSAGRHTFYATDISPRFQEIAALFFGSDFSELNHVDLVSVAK